MKETLYTCPHCGTPKFTSRGLRAHRCPILGGLSLTKDCYDAVVTVAALDPVPPFRMALSIRQPWAWLILNAGKDIENRERKFRYTGLTVIHASSRMSLEDYFACALFVAGLPGKEDLRLPDPDALPRGGIVGQVNITGCVEKSESHWFCGPHGLTLAEPKPLAFVPYKGLLGFFPVPTSILKEAA